MKKRLRRDGANAVKLLRADQAVSGPMIARRSELLVAAGNRTPVVSYDTAARAIVYPWIEGRTARENLQEMVRRSGPLTTSQTALPPLLVGVVAVLARLHKTDPTGLALLPLDTGRMIRPRLEGLPPADVLRREAAELHARSSRALQRRRELVEASRLLLHGDFHVGQLLFEAGSDEPWLLDLDDLVLGPRESDIANFVAHLSTRPDLASGDIARDYAMMLNWIGAAYIDHARCRLDGELLAIYGATSLLRRGLKLHSRGCGGVDAILTTARELLAGVSD